MKITKTLFLVISILAIFLAGCSKNSVKPNQEQEVLNLESEFGGYLATSESPAFGNVELLSEQQSDIAYDDQILLNPEVSEITADANAGVYHLRVVWGQLRFDSTVENNTAWNGSLTISRGAEVIRRLINFEEGQDYILPRDSRKKIEWVSVTSVHSDGIAVDIFIPPLKPIFDSIYVNDTLVIDTVFPDDDEVTVRFETGPYSRVFDIEELQSLDTIVFLEDSNALAFHAFRLDRHRCPRGFLAGHWGVDENGKGVFRGKWMNESGMIVGYLQGHHGQRKNGENVFFGKWISVNGNFEGFVRGFFQPIFDGTDPESIDQNFGGYFYGGIFNAEKMLIGLMGGRFANPEDGQRGFFQGRWKIGCPHESFSDGMRDEGM